MAAAQSNADSQDSELAAILDDELFGNVGAAGADGVGAAVAVEGPLADNAAVVPLKIAGTEEQPAKRARPNYYNGIIVGDTNLAADTAEKASICPPHPGWWMDMCIRCGAVRTSRDMEPAAPTGPAGPGAAGMQPATTLIKHLHHKQALEVSADEAARIATGSLQRLLASRRLILVLDLDHTLLNTVRDIDLVGKERQAAIRQLKEQHQQLQQQQQRQQPPGKQEQQQGKQEQQRNQQQRETAQQVQKSIEQEQDPGLEEKQPVANADQQLPSQQHQQHTKGEEKAHSGSPKAADNSNIADAGQKQQKEQQQQLGPRAQLFQFADKGLWTKLRPGVSAFLAAVAPLYELHIYTMGDKGYAGLMADVLDPEHKLFVGRVISAADSTRAGQKDLDVLLADESLVLILDDTEQVWEKHRANLIQVERYHYFGASTRLFHHNAQSPLEQGADEPESGGVLDTAAQLLVHIHARVYGSTAAEEQQQHAAAAGRVAAGDEQGIAGGLEVLHEQQQQQAHPEQLQQQQSGGLGVLHQHQQQQLGGRRIMRRVQQPGQQQQPPVTGSNSNASTAANQPHPGGGDNPMQIRDVRECLAEERRGILSGCCIVFSR
eukprot:GHRR01003806.1.p1 GENE.GHRR01003806.1~~GHRR01003806.1.p1  ORF type:complete len:605 (+),score=304.07 GHRR01003806.1:163-1977(+)